MIYCAEITTPYNTQKSNEKVTTLDVDKGMVYRIEIQFPPGPAWLSGCRIFDQLTQVFPKTMNEYFIGNSMLLSYDELYEVKSMPYEFYIHTYNTSIHYDHKCIVRIIMETKDAYMSKIIPALAYQDITNMLAATQGGAIEKSEAAKQLVEYLSKRRVIT